MLFTIPKIYPITDTRISRLSHAAQVELLAAGGATLIQIREKSLSSRAFFDVATEVMKIARRMGVQIIINDRVDIAVAVGADGVHLGQDDLPPDRARQLLGPARIVGFSTHNLEQAVAAGSMPLDYIALGPVFQTRTKENPDPVIGLEAIAEARRRITKPLVAIGGITLDRAKDVLAAGADGVAVISDILLNDIAQRTREYLRISST